MRVYWLTFANGILSDRLVIMAISSFWQMVVKGRQIRPNKASALQVTAEFHPDSATAG